MGKGARHYRDRLAERRETELFVDAHPLVGEVLHPARNQIGDERGLSRSGEPGDDEGASGDTDKTSVEMQQRGLPVERDPHERVHDVVAEAEVAVGFPLPTIHTDLTAVIDRKLHIDPCRVDHDLVGEHPGDLLEPFSWRSDSDEVLSEPDHDRCRYG